MPAPDGERLRVEFLEAVTSPAVDASLLRWIEAENARFPRDHAAALIFNTAVQDWRDLIPTIAVPTLVVAGDSVNVPLRSQEWIAEQIHGAELAVVRTPSGGTHFPFLECPGAFNDAVSSFLSARGLSSA